MNSVKVNGNLTREPKITNFTYLNKEKKEITRKRAVFTVANNIVKGRKLENANFIIIVAFGKLAEITETNLNKGDSVIVEGFLNSGSYEKDGVKVTTVTVIADDIEFVKLKTKDLSSETIVEDEFKPIEQETLDNIDFDSFSDGVTEELPLPF